MGSEEIPLDLTLPEGERDARQRYLMMLQENPEYLGCWDCLMVFTDPFIFSLHNSTHDPSRSLTCACGRAFTSRNEFQKHVIEEAHPV